jgi:membrane-associated phospholipid phosphatase
VTQAPTATRPAPSNPVDAARDAKAATERIGRRGTHTKGVVLARGRVGQGVAGAAFAGFAAIYGLVRAKRSEAFDVALMVKLQRRQGSLVNSAMRAASWPGFPPQSRIIPPIVIATFMALGLRIEAFCQTLGWMTGLLSSVLKTSMRRPRPGHPDIRVVVAPLGGSSFPSGHVITYVGTYGFLAYLLHSLIRPIGLRRALVGGLLGLVGLVGPSRIHQGHHWPTDVLASYLLGISYLIGLTSLYRRLKQRLARR